MGALDTLSDIDTLSQLQDGQSAANAPTANQNDYGALESAKPPLDPNDVEARKQIFSSAADRIMQMRNQRQAPYNGADMGLLAFGKNLTANNGANSARDFTNAMYESEVAKQSQRDANTAFAGQQQGLDIRASIAKILSSPTMGDEDKLQSMYQLSILGGDEKGAQSAASMLRAMHTGVAGRAVSVLNEQGKPEMVSAQDAVKRHLAPIVRDPTTGAILNQTGAAGSQVTPPKVQEIWTNNDLGAAPIHISKDEYKDNEAEYKKLVDVHDSAMNAAKVADQAKDALKSYWGGPAGQTLADWDASLPDALQSKAAQNTQFLNKKSGELAMQIANASKGMRIGIGMERFAKSTTIDTRNSKETNKKIVENLQEMPMLTQQQKNMEAYVKQFPAQHKEAIKDAFYQDYPLMIEQGGDKPAIINPAYKDPQLFKKWLQNKAGNTNDDDPGANEQPPSNAKQAGDGNYYLPDPNRPGKYLQWQPSSQ